MPRVVGTQTHGTAKIAIGGEDDVDEPGEAVSRAFVLAQGPGCHFQNFLLVLHGVHFFQFTLPGLNPLGKF